MADIDKLKQHTEGPIPEELLALLPDVLHLGETRRRVRREKVDGLGPAVRRELWFTAQDGAGTYNVWPFRDDTGVFGLGAAADIRPFMRRLTLAKHGWTDDTLEAKREELFGPLGPGELRLDAGEPDSIPLKERRRAVYEAVIARLLQP
jgi:hypothetical protein